MEDSNTDYGDNAGEDEDNRWCCFSVNLYMLPVKVAFFFWGARNVIDSYFLLFFVSLGFNAGNASIIIGFMYIGGFLGGPFWGFIADKFRIHRILTVVTCIMATLAMCSQPFLGVAFGEKGIFKCPSNTTLQKSFQQQFNTHHTHDRLFYSVLFSSVIGISFDAGLVCFVDARCLQRIKSTPVGKQYYFLVFGTVFGGIMCSGVIMYFPSSNISCESGIFIVYFAVILILGIICYHLHEDSTVTSEDKNTINDDTTVTSEDKNTINDDTTVTSEDKNTINDDTTVTSEDKNTINDDTTVTSEDKNTINDEFMKDILTTFKDYDVLFFFSSVLFSGIMHAVFYSFLYLYLKELNAIPLIYSIHSFVTSASGGIVYYLSESIISSLGGNINTMCFTCFVWVFRYLCVSFIKNPYLIMVSEMSNGISFSLFNVASLKHVKDVSASGILTVMCGIRYALFYQLSLVIANFLGGQLYNIYGGAVLYRMSGIALCGGWGVVMLLYILAKHLYRGDYKRLNAEEEIKDH